MGRREKRCIVGVNDLTELVVHHEELLSPVEFARLQIIHLRNGCIAERWSVEEDAVPEDEALQHGEAVAFLQVSAHCCSN